MNFVGYVACYLSILLNLAVLVWCYSKTGVERKTSKIKCFVSIIVLSIFMLLVNFFVTTSVKFVLIYLLLLLLFFPIIKKNIYILRYLKQYLFIFSCL